MRLVYFISALLLMGGCQDTSQDQQENSLNTVHTNLAENSTTLASSEDDQYHAEGLTRFDNNTSDEPLDKKVVKEPNAEPISSKASKQSTDKPPIRIELKLNPVWAEYEVGMIDVQAITDQVIIEKIILNRGQCSAIDNSRPLPVTLNFGRTYTGYINDCSLSKVIEIQIKTNVGSWTFNK